MKTLIYSVNPQSPHMETDLELAWKLKERGDRITMLRCTGQLKASLFNPNHSSLLCASCISKYDKAISLAGLSGVDIQTLSLAPSSYETLPKSFADVEALKSFTFQGADAGNAVASTLIGRFGKDHRFDTVAYEREVYRELRMWVDIYIALEKFLRDLQPDEVYFFNGRFSSYHPLKYLCNKYGITYYTHERAGVLNKYIIRKNAMPHDIDYSVREIIELWGEGDEEKVRIGSTFFTDRRNNVIQSWVSFTESQKKGLLPEGFSQDKKNIVIFNSSMEEYEGMEGWQNPMYKDDNEGIRRVLDAFTNEPDYVFYLRVHPNLKLLRNTQMKEIEEMEHRYTNLRLIRPEAVVDSYALMEYADKVLTFGSTVGVESTFWNKTSILMGKSMYMNIGACYQPSSHEEAVQLIKTANLAPKEKINAIKYGYWELMKGEFYERFKQVDLFTMACDGQLVKASRVLRVLEKIPKLRLVRNERDWSNVKAKIKKVVGWK